MPANQYLGINADRDAVGAGGEVGAAGDTDGATEAPQPTSKADDLMGPLLPLILLKTSPISFLMPTPMTVKTMPMRHGLWHFLFCL